MRRGQTYLERQRGKPPGVDVLVALWNEALTYTLLQMVWMAYDRLSASGWGSVDWTLHYDDVERSLSEDLERAIHDVMDSTDGGYLPVYLQHGPSERESRKPPPAQPPEYDMAFQWRDDPRVMWPLEAKMLPHDRDTDENLDKYVVAVNEKFLTCQYAPFANGGAMLGYLKAGDPEVVSGFIGLRLGAAMLQHPVFSTRCHKVSEHIRLVPDEKDYPSEFGLHHLILPLSA